MKQQQQQQPRSSSSQDSSAQDLPSLLQQEQPYKWEARPLSVDHKPERHDEYVSCWCQFASEALEGLGRG